MFYKHFVIPAYNFMETQTQQQLYDWLAEYIRHHQHCLQFEMMQAMKLKSPAPIQSRLEHLRAKGYIEWAEGKARTIGLCNLYGGVPVLCDRWWFTRTIY